MTSLTKIELAFSVEVVLNRTVVSGAGVVLYVVFFVLGGVVAVAYVAVTVGFDFVAVDNDFRVVSRSSIVVAAGVLSKVVGNLGWDIVVGNEGLSEGV